MTTDTDLYPEYSRAERLFDGVIHVLGMLGSVAGAGYLLHVAVSTGNTVDMVASTVYCIGLIAMLWTSAAYHIISRADWKERIRRFDHAAIFLMIAGTYTPFSLTALSGPAGYALLTLVWIVAISGIWDRLKSAHRPKARSVALYVFLGWLALPLTGLLVAALSTPTLILLVVGGVLYTAGIGFHLWERLPHHNAIWHTFVLIAAVCHFIAVVRIVGG